MIGACEENRTFMSSSSRTFRSSPTRFTNVVRYFALYVFQTHSIASWMV